MEAGQFVPVVPGDGRGFRAYSAGELDRLLARAGLDGAERLAVGRWPRWCPSVPMTTSPST